MRLNARRLFGPSPGVIEIDLAVVVLAGFVVEQERGYIQRILAIELDDLGLG